MNEGTIFVMDLNIIINFQIPTFSNFQIGYEIYANDIGKN